MLPIQLLIFRSMKESSPISRWLSRATMQSRRGPYWSTFMIRLRISARPARLRRPGGKFVFLVTNFASTSSRHLFREDVPRHLYFFSKETVKRYLELSGLKLDRAVYDDSVYGMQPANWMRYLLYKSVLRREMEWTDLPPTQN